MQKMLATLNSSSGMGDAHKKNELDVLAHESHASVLENEMKHSEMMMEGKMHEMVLHAELPDTRPQDIVEDGRDGAKQGREDIELLTRQIQSLDANHRARSGEDDYVFPDPIPVPQELPRTPEKVGPSLKDRFKMAGKRLNLVETMGIKRSPRPLHEAASMGDVFDMNELMVDPEEEARKRKEEGDEDEEQDGGEEGFSLASVFAKDSKLGGKHDPDERNSSNQTPMHFAACHGHEEAISALLHRGANMNLQDKQGQTPLHFAAAYGRENIVASLLRLPECDPTIRDNSLQTPLHVAVRLQQLPIYRLLREHPSGDAAARMRDVEGRLPASLAPNKKGRALAVECDGVVASLKNVARRGGEEVLRNLLTHDDARFVLGWHDEVGRGLIHYAACHGRPELCRLLLDPKFTSPEEVATIASGKDGRGFTALHYAASWGHTESMAVLLDTADAEEAPAYADARREGFAASTASAARMVNARDTAGRTALHCAAMEGRDEAVALLLLRGGSVSAEDFAGQTPEDVACNGKILKLLASVHKPPGALPPDNIDVLAQSVAQHRAKYREAARGTGEQGVFPIEDDTEMELHRTNRAGPMPMLVDGVEMLVSTQSEGYVNAVHKPQHVHHAKEQGAPPPPPPPGAPPLAEEDILLGRAIRNRHHHKKKSHHKHHDAAAAAAAGGGEETPTASYMTPTVSSTAHETPHTTPHHMRTGMSDATSHQLASRLDDNFVHDAAAAAVAGDIANHMDGHALLEAVEHGAARQVRKRSFFVHILH
jgi:ankyrin repeat protein